MDEVEKAARLGLWAIRGVGPVAFRRVEALTRGSVAQLLGVPPREWVQRVGLRSTARATLESIGLLGSSERTVAAVRRAGARVLYRGERGYPEPLSNVADAPPLLFAAGAPPVTSADPSPGGALPLIAVVGSRRVDSNALRAAARVGEALAQAGLGVVSGAAEGVDQAAHRGCVAAGGPTVAFLGCGPDEIDSTRLGLLRQLGERATFLTELPPGVSASKSTFPRRNRLISGASRAVVVIRAGLRSGTLHTVAAAERQGRPLFAIPGDPDFPATAGTNALLRDGRAGWYEGVDGLCAQLGLSARGRKAGAGGAPDGLEEALSPQARVVFALLERGRRTLDELLNGAKLPGEALIEALCELELSGLVHQRPGKVFERR